MKKHVVIVAGGIGKRFNKFFPKQFIELNGKPMMMHTIDKFFITYPGINIVIVLAEELTETWQLLCKKHKYKIPHQIIVGGKTRFHSVKNGLTLIPDNCLVAIHDAARPFVNKKTIETAFAMAEKSGNAIPIAKINDSIRNVKGKKNKAVNRKEYKIIQTPQCFQSTLIKKAFTQKFKSTFTDDASVLEAMGEKINLIEGNIENIKITTPLDLVFAEAIMKSDFKF